MVYKVYTSVGYTYKTPWGVYFTAEKANAVAAELRTEYGLEVYVIPEKV